MRTSWALVLNDLETPTTDHTQAMDNPIFIEFICLGNSIRLYRVTGFYRCGGI